MFIYLSFFFNCKILYIICSHIWFYIFFLLENISFYLWIKKMIILSWNNLLIILKCYNIRIHVVSRSWNLLLLLLLHHYFILIFQQLTQNYPLIPSLRYLLVYPLAFIYIFIFKWITFSFGSYFPGPGTCSFIKLWNFFYVVLYGAN